MEPLYQLHTIMTKDDYINFNLYYMQESKNGKKTVLISKCLVPLILIVEFLIFGLKKETWHIILAIYAVISVLWWLVVPRLTVWLLKKNIMAMGKDGKLPYATEATVTFYDDYLTDENDEVELKIRYSQLEKLIENKNCYYIFYNSAQAEFIPFDAFKDDNERAMFEQFIERKIMMEG